MKLIVTAFVLGLSFSAHSTTTGEVSMKTKEAAQSAVDYTMEQKEAFQKSMEKNLNALESEVAELKAKATTAHGAAQAKTNSKIKDLETKQGELQKKMSDLKKSTGKAWVKMKDGMSSAWSKAKETISEAEAEMKK